MGWHDAGFSNETHQLLVSVSRHLSVTRKGMLVYQEKPLEVTIGNYWKSNREHLVYYILRDRFSGNFIFDATTTSRMVPLVDFLYFGWARDTGEDHFWGLPVTVSVPKRVSTPELLQGLQKLEVEPFHPSSGFASGIHLVKALEDQVCLFVLRRSSLHFPASIHRFKKEIYHNILESSVVENNAEKWRLNLPPDEPRPVPDYRSFVSAFPEPSGIKPGLPLRSARPDRVSGDLVGLPASFTTPLTDIPFSQDKLEKAEAMNDRVQEAYETEKDLKVCYQALEISPYCADALNTLALRSDSLEEKLFLSQRAVQAGQAALGEAFIRENAGHFWGLTETRPYLRALYGLAECLWKKGQGAEAIPVFWEMLRLNPNDQQGARNILGSRLLEEQRTEELDRLFAEYGQNECTCFILYNKALHLFRKNDPEADEVLGRALRSNRHVCQYLSGEKFLSFRLPDYPTRGEPSEAIWYAKHTKKAWEDTEGALEWLKHMVAQQTKTVDSRTDSPTIEQVMKEFFDDRVNQLAQETRTQYLDVLGLLQDYLEAYGYSELNQEESRRYEEQEDDEGELVFCRLFGPDKIVDNIGQFLGYFMSNKVICEKELLQASGSVMKELALWMLDQGYIDQDQADFMIEYADDAYHNLPAADDLNQALHLYLATQPLIVEGDTELDDLFDVIEVKPGSLSLSAPGMKKPVRVRVPNSVSSLCQPGWTLSLLLLKTSKGWVIAESRGVFLF